jgi:hypothetical protein
MMDVRLNNRGAAGKFDRLAMAYQGYPAGIKTARTKIKRCWKPKGPLASKERAENAGDDRSRTISLKSWAKVDR